MDSPLFLFSSNLLGLGWMDHIKRQPHLYNFLLLSLVTYEKKEEEKRHMGVHKPTIDHSNRCFSCYASVSRSKNPISFDELIYFPCGRKTKKWLLFEIYVSATYHDGCRIICVCTLRQRLLFFSLIIT